MRPRPSYAIYVSNVSIAIGLEKASRLERGMQESNLQQRVWNPVCYHYTNPPYVGYLSCLA